MADGDDRNDVLVAGDWLQTVQAKDLKHLDKWSVRLIMPACWLRSIGQGTSCQLEAYHRLNGNYWETEWLVAQNPKKGQIGITGVGQTPEAAFRDLGAQLVTWTTAGRTMSSTLAPIQHGREPSDRELEGLGSPGPTHRSAFDPFNDIELLPEERPTAPGLLTYEELLERERQDMIHETPSEGDLFEDEDEGLGAVGLGAIGPSVAWVHSVGNQKVVTSSDGEIQFFLEKRSPPMFVTTFEEPYAMAIGPFFFFSRARGGWSDLKPADVPVQGWMLDQLYQEWRSGVPGIHNGDGFWEMARPDEMVQRIIALIDPPAGAPMRGPAVEALAVAADYLLDRGYPPPTWTRR